MPTRRSPDFPTLSEPVAKAPPVAPPRKAPEPAAPRPKVTAEARRRLIAESAYLRAERRGFVPGGETDDWLAAEAEVDALLRATRGGAAQ